jgi:hypothetical protein
MEGLAEVAGELLPEKPFCGGVDLLMAGVAEGPTDLAGELAGILLGLSRASCGDGIVVGSRDSFGTALASDDDSLS